jgi:formylglycine-generating enzyme required for sulfatase activity
LPVGSFKPNPFGVFDTSGNVAEWVEDCWNDNYRGAPADGSPWITGQCRLRVLRGGAFDSQSSMWPRTRGSATTTTCRYSSNGFRLVRELP